uniref:Uncharacterized protein n=1 Tax=Cacopsylla melanoneura TaxID=428564 RepID=A0A8D8SG42_9HEMI
MRLCQNRLVGRYIVLNGTIKKKYIGVKSSIYKSEESESTTSFRGRRRLDVSFFLRSKRSCLRSRCSCLRFFSFVSSCFSFSLCSIRLRSKRFCLRFFSCSFSTCLRSVSFIGFILVSR